MKRTITFVLMLTICFAFTFCGIQNSAFAEEAVTTAQANSVNLKGQSLLIYCGAGMQKPFQKIADAFQAETGCEMNVTYANAGQIQAQISEAKQGAFFIAGSQEEVKPVASYVINSTPLVKHIPVLAVASGNPKNIKGIADLARKDVVTVIGDPKSTPIGKIAMKAFGDFEVKEKVNLVFETTFGP